MGAKRKRFDKASERNDTKISKIRRRGFRRAFKQRLVGKMKSSSEKNSKTG